MKKNSNFIQSLICAFKGIIHVINAERNFRVHIFFSVLAITLSLILKISFLELSIIFIMIAIVLVLLIINTITENIMDFLCKNYNFKVKIIKDMASGAVLVSAFISVIVGYLIFVPKILVIIGG